jgi:hypothetical protein
MIYVCDFLFNDVVVGEADKGLRTIVYLVILLALRDYILFECTWFESLHSPS